MADYEVTDLNPSLMRKGTAIAVAPQLCRDCPHGRQAVQTAGTDVRPCLPTLADTHAARVLVRTGWKGRGSPISRRTRRRERELGEPAPST